MNATGSTALGALTGSRPPSNAGCAWEVLAGGSASIILRLCPGQHRAKSSQSCAPQPRAFREGAANIPWSWLNSKHPKHVSKAP